MKKHLDASTKDCFILYDPEEQLWLNVLGSCFCSFTFGKIFEAYQFDTYEQANMFRRAYDFENLEIKKVKIKQTIIIQEVE